MPDILAIILFAVIGFVYFMPADIDGRVLYREDSSAGRGLGQESKLYLEKTGERTRWTNSAFSGMPTYQVSPSYTSTNVLGKMENAYHLWLPENVWYVFAYLLGFYILLRAFDFKQYLAVLGSILWAFSSYFFIIIAAGHIWKVMALAYLPPMIAGLVLCYRGKYLWGLIVTAIFTAFEINANHVHRDKKLPQFVKGSVVCAVGALLGVLINISNLYHTWEYTKESMRGKSELVKKNSSNQTSSGLDRDYITQWSYGIGETWTLLVPNTKGGASVPLAQNAKAMEKADPNFMQIYGTSGPVYVGAFVLMLFILGLFIVKGPMKWALLAATILSILLSWGRNFMGFTNFFLDYIPMYAKFRTVASILVIAEFTIPLLAMMALKKIIDEPEILKTKIRWVWVSFALTGGIALLFWLMPSVFFPDYISVQENQALAQIPAEYLGPLKSNLTAIREYIFSSDALRSFIIVALGTALLMLYKYKKFNTKLLVGCVTVLCLVDMWQVNKRYLNDGMFVEASVRNSDQPMTATDRQILKDKGLDYRVLNLASNTFNENETSYYHKSIGGYHPAKLRRYQEMIDAYIAPEMQKMMPAISKAGGDMTKVDGSKVWPVLNMLNAKYFILPLQSGQTVPLQNPYVQGNAWFVDKVDYVDNANQEIDRVGKIDLHHEAVADKQFSEQLGKAVKQDGTSMAVIKSYEPNHLTYEVNSDKGGVLVFSEIYYPEWTATVDGQKAELGRVNYILRALNVKPGKHEVVLDFHPASIRTTETLAYCSYGILALLIAAGAFMARRKNKEKK